MHTWLSASRWSPIFAWILYYLVSCIILYFVLSCILYYLVSGFILYYVLSCILFYFVSCIILYFVLSCVLYSSNEVAQGRLMIGTTLRYLRSREGLIVFFFSMSVVVFDMNPIFHFSMFYMSPTLSDLRLLLQSSRFPNWILGLFIELCLLLYQLNS